MSWESRRAHAMPAGPPPTMTMSASITGRSILGSGLRNTIIGKIHRAKVFVLIFLVICFAQLGNSVRAMTSNTRTQRYTHTTRVARLLHTNKTPTQESSGCECSGHYYNVQ